MGASVVTRGVKPPRPAVGIALINCNGKVLLARKYTGHWQMPQGGLRCDEGVVSGALRELREEVGTDHVLFLGIHPEQFTYSIPSTHGKPIHAAKYCGQRQSWVALQFIGEDSEIRLDDPTHWVDGETHQEFDEWRWAHPSELPFIAVSYKQSMYRGVAEWVSDWCALAERQFCVRGK